MSTFNANDWFLVGDTNICPYSKEQIKICQNLNIQVKGAVLCNDAENTNNPACLQVPAFPAFCHVEKNMCISGLRETTDSFEDLILASIAENLL